MLEYLPRRDLADRSAVYRFLLDYNPFYVLSAIFMLAGLFTLNDSLDFSPLPVGNVLILIATLNLYEMLLIGMACFLYAHGAKRDATILLIIEAVFLVDGGFLSAEVVTQDLAIGQAVNAALLAAALLKVGVIFRALGLPIRSGPFALIMTQVAVIILMPGIFKSASNAHGGALPPLAMYAVWWVVGAVVALYGLLLARVDFSDAPRIERFGRHRVVIGALLVLAFLSIIAHLCTANWVYNVRWYSANLAPVVLGLAVAVAVVPSGVLRYRRRMQAQLVLPLAAIALSLAFPATLEFGRADVPLTPLRLTLLGAAAVYLVGFATFRQILFAWLSACCVLTAALGSSVAAIVENLMYLNRSAAMTARSVTPRGPMHWGVVWIGLSFLLLLVGMVLSLKNAARRENG